MSDGTAATPGTTITLYLNEDSYEFSNEYRAREVLEKYCSFMPIPIPKGPVALASRLFFKVEP